MSIFVFALAMVAPFMYAMTNHIDKIILSKYFRDGGVGTLILFSSLLSILAIPVIIFMEPTVLDVSLFHAVVLATVGGLTVLLLWCYLKALEHDEASVVIIFYQLVPVFALGLGYLILGETLTKMQLISMAIIMLGTSIVTFEIDAENGFSVRWKTVVYMLIATSCWAIESVIFKAVALEENVWRSLFWEHAALVLIGVFLLTFVSHYRTHFITAIKENSAAILSVNVLNETFYMFGNITVAFAVMLAPVALVLLNQSFQSFFVLVIGLLLTLLAPSLTAEKIEVRNLAQKLFAIIITGIGTYLLLS